MAYKYEFYFLFTICLKIEMVLSTYCILINVQYIRVCFILLTVVLKLPHQIVVRLYYAFVFVALTAVIHIVTVEYLIARESLYVLLQ